MGGKSRNGSDAFFDRSVKSGVLTIVSHTAVANSSIKHIFKSGSRSSADGD
jgi:hypothetical protein